MCPIFFCAFTKSRLKNAAAHFLANNKTPSAYSIHFVAALRIIVLAHLRASAAGCVLLFLQHHTLLFIPFKWRVTTTWRTTKTNDSNKTIAARTEARSTLCSHFIPHKPGSHQSITGCWLARDIMPSIFRCSQGMGGLKLQDTRNGNSATSYRSGSRRYYGYNGFAILVYTTKDESSFVAVRNATALTKPH